MCGCTSKRLCPTHERERQHPRRWVMLIGAVVVALVPLTGCHVNAWDTPGGVASRVRG